jgi:hypothetical protein
MQMRSSIRKSSNISRWLLACAQLLCASAFIDTAAQHPRAPANDVYQIIKDVSKEEAADPASVIIVRPVFKTGTLKSTNGKWLDYDLGEIAVDYLGLPEGDSYKLPYAMQLQIEALRREFEEKAPNLPFWQQPLLNAEQTVRDTVSDIQSFRGSPQLDAQLAKRRKEFQAQLSALEQSIKDYAQKTSTGVGEPGRVGPLGFGAEDQFAVPITTEPTGGRVRVVTAFVWRDCSKRSCAPVQLTWRTLNADRENMIGGYHYIAEWSDGRRDEGDIRIDSDAKRTFRPNNH